MTFGFFIDPSPALASLVLERKAAAGTRWPQATYLSHPVHATLLAGAFAEMSEWLPLLSARVATAAPFWIECRTPVVFANDPITGGATVVIDVVPSAALHALQLMVAETVAPFRDVAVAESLAARVRDAEAAECTRAFGSPWVGAHWRPHFTIGSFAVDPSAPDLASLLAPFAPLSVPVRSVSVWKIAGDVHERCAEITFGGAVGG